MNVSLHGARRAQDVRKRLSHPVIDGDGHVLEAPTVLLDYVKQVAGAEVARRFQTRPTPWAGTGMKSIFWGMPSGPHTADRAAAMLPRLYAERIAEAGIDHGIVYSTAVLPLMHEGNAELRRAGHRALNMLLADMFRGTERTLTPSAGIPMHTPEEALAELDFAVNTLGFKAATFGTEVWRAPPEIEREAPQLAEKFKAVYPVALDSRHDYDPVWRKCLELKIAVASHTSARGNWGRRVSPTNYVFNHLGDFAEGGDYFCRCLFLGGVTRRFPGLNFAFLEGGVGWAAQLYNNIVEHWEKRNPDMLRANLDPATLDLDLMAELAAKYGGGLITPEAARAQPRRNAMGGIVDVDIDEFKACGIESIEDIAALFAASFYFGCEADDRMNVVAFETRLHHCGVKLKAMFGSDIGHWDVMDMNMVLPQAYELVEEGLMSELDFRAFVCGNPAGFFTRQNPDFFTGTTVEGAA